MDLAPAHISGGPQRTWRSSPLADVAKYLLVVGFLTWLAARGTLRLGYDWQWERIPGYLFHFDQGAFTLGPLLQGLLVTFKITGIGLILSFCFGLAGALMRLSDSIMARATARVYVETIRNTPLLIQLFFIYFVLAPIIGLERFTAAVLALSLFEGAYASEIIRSGIVSIHLGQWQAAYSLGLSGYHTYSHIILPQAFRRILPPLTSQAISLIKDSALVSTIAIYDLTMQGQAIVAETFLTFEVWFTVAGIYLVVTLCLSLLVNLMEHRLKMNVS